MRLGPSGGARGLRPSGGTRGLRPSGGARGLLFLASAVWLGSVACSGSEPGSRPPPAAAPPSTPAEARPAARPGRGEQAGPVAETGSGRLDPSGYAVARGSREWSFPRDHGSHPAYATEWWYATGILRTAEGRRFGYELTFFRVGLDSRESRAQAAAGRPGPAPGPGGFLPASDGAAPRRISPWRARDLILAHATLTDVDGARFLVDHRESRAAQGWAGADTARLEVWVDDWRMAQLATAKPGPPSAFTVRVPASSTDGRFGLDLRLESSRPPVLHARGGLSPKDGRAEPHASWYASLPRLGTRGTLSIGGERFQVSGATWMDHEFFTGGLAPSQVGWDWFSARFEDGRDLMLYRLRRKDGGTDYLAGTVVAAGGASWRDADVRDAVFEPLERWRSPAGGVAYPVAWRVRLPAERLELTVATPLPAQEVRTGGPTFDYWEGLVDYRGTWRGARVRAEGYLEMTGYGAPLDLR